MKVCLNKPLKIDSVGYFMLDAVPVTQATASKHLTELARRQQHFHGVAT